MTHPYEKLGSEAYWKTAVADRGAFDIEGLWQPKFEIRQSDKIVTAGSCFAQHIGKALQGRGYQWFDAEPAPPYLVGADRARFNYGIFSSRTGNIYTPKMLNQWLDLAYGRMYPEIEHWEQNGRFYDPLRPVIEPDGFASPAELMRARATTCEAIRRSVEQADVFVFTLGLTESWINTQTGLEYALCPGTAAGQFDEEKHKFQNANLRMVLRELTRALKAMRMVNANLRVLLTVSPVPLTATASGKHVLTATHYSKSVLRAVAGQVADEMKFVDYFPSYEIITHPVFRGMFYAPNMRSVVPGGVDTVMGHFFADQQRAFGKSDQNTQPTRSGQPVNAEADKVLAEDEIKCEEELLGAFAA